MATVSSEKHGRSKNQEPHYELPEAETFKEAGELIIKNEQGEQVQFKNIYENKPGTQQLIIFIRHFFCGVSPLMRTDIDHCHRVQQRSKVCFGLTWSI